MTDCNCPDWVNPCKHIAAVHYILGERFDEDPFMIFRLRGRTQEQILEALRQRRSGQLDLDEEAFDEDPEVVIPLEETLDHFWDLAESLEGISVSIKPPAITMPLLKRLGEAQFVREHRCRSSWVQPMRPSAGKPSRLHLAKDAAEAE